jgi:GTP-binding protein
MLMRLQLRPGCRFERKFYKTITRAINQNAIEASATNNGLSNPAPPNGALHKAPVSFSASDLNLYSTSDSPTKADLDHARKIFESKRPFLLQTVEKFRELHLSHVPEVAFIGRSNVGKSSLLNALLNRTTNKLAHVSSKPGRTRTMNAYGIGGVQQMTERHMGKRFKVWDRKTPDGFVILDMPGYGAGSKSTWGENIIKYLTRRVEYVRTRFRWRCYAKAARFRRTFLLIDSEHGVKSLDKNIVELLASNDIPYQIILTKVDKLVPKHIRNLKKASFTQAQLNYLYEQLLGASFKVENELDRITGNHQRHRVVLACSTDSNGSPLGKDGVRYAVLQAAQTDRLAGRGTD